MIPNPIIPENPMRNAMSQEENKLSVDTLAQEIRRVDGDHSLGADALAEALMPFLSRRASAGGEAVAWRCEDLILPSVSIIDDWEHAQMRLMQPKAWKVTPLYAAPSPSPAPVADDAKTLLIYLRGCLSREDEDGMIDVPADYITRSIALLSALHPKAVPDVSEEMRKALAVYGQWVMDVATRGELANLERRMNAVGIGLDQLGGWTAAALSAAQGVE